MAISCGAPDPDLGLVKGLLDNVDCNVRSLTETSYAALSQPNSPMAAALTLMLTLYIGFIGFRLLIGRSPLSVGEVTVSALKLGAVLALATSWPTYQQVVFDVLFRGPEQLAAEIMRNSGSSASTDVFGQLQATYDQLQAATANFGKPAAGAVPSLLGGGGWSALELTLSSLIMLLMTLGVVLAAKIALGLLLGLGPVFVAMLLFEATRGLFEGWLRASIAFAIAPLTAIVGLVLQLALLAPHMEGLDQAGGQLALNPDAANAIFLLTLICAGVGLALLMAVGAIAASFRLPREKLPAFFQANAAPVFVSGGRAEVAAPAQLAPAHPRALAIAAAAAAMDRRDSRFVEDVQGTRRISVGGGRSEPLAGAVASAPLGQSHRRAATPRRAASNRRRDG
jgi:type IV secretion system protein VirB6